MSEYYLSLPEMGESVVEATITRWLKNEGEPINEGEVLVEIATDKVDSEVNSPVNGIFKKKMFSNHQVVGVGEVIAILEVESENTSSKLEDHPQKTLSEKKEPLLNSFIENKNIESSEKIFKKKEKEYIFYSPLIRSIAQKEAVSFDELSQIKGKGKKGRITKDDLQAYLKERSEKKFIPISESFKIKPDFSESKEEIIEMDRVRRLIAKHMLNSKSVSAHVTSFIEADVTKIVQWRQKIKDSFKERTGEKLTFMPFFVKALVKSIKDFPLINSVIKGDYIIRKKNINIGVAIALPNGNLIVPVIKNAETYNLTGLAIIINDLAHRARNNTLKPEDTQGGTYSITNMGSFGNSFGTPIIHQPQLAILGVGVIEKKPAIISTDQGEVIAIRHKMFLSHSYDHSVIDGALGGGFVKRVAYYLENFHTNEDKK